MRAIRQPGWPYMAPAILTVALVVTACTGSRPTLEPTTTTSQVAGTTAPPAQPTSTTSQATATTAPPVTTTTFVRLDPNDPSYPSVVPLEPIPPAEYPTTG